MYTSLTLMGHTLLSTCAPACDPETWSQYPVQSDLSRKYAVGSCSFDGASSCTFPAGLGHVSVPSLPAFLLWFSPGSAVGDLTLVVSPSASQSAAACQSCCPRSVSGIQLRSQLCSSWCPAQPSPAQMRWGLNWHTKPGFNSTPALRTLPVPWWPCVPLSF